VWVLYLIPLFLVYETAKRPCVYSVIVTLLIAAGWFLSSPDGTSLMHSAANRITGIFGGWGVSVLLMQRKRLHTSLLRVRNELEKRVTDRTAELSRANRSLQEEIEEHKQVEIALKESENKFRDLSEESLVGVYLIQDDTFKYVNPTFAEIFGYTAEELIDRKRPADVVLPEDVSTLEENMRKRLSAEVRSIHYNLKGIKKDRSAISIEVYGSRTIYRGRPAVIGTLLDSTKRKKNENERERLIDELKEALSKVRTLSGMLPICSSCKKIRDDKGYWNQVEEYIAEHSSAVFSHGFCPECALKMHEEIDKKKRSVE
jgi:PAS domain S-box-containing protein